MCIGLFLFWSLYKTNRFHVAVGLFSNRSQMTSKCGKNNEVAHEPQAEWVTDVFTTFWRPLWSITEQTHGNMESICFIQWSEKKKTNTHTCLVPLDCSKICASLGIFLSPKRYISSLLLFFLLYLTCKQFLRKGFQRLFLFKAEYWRKNFAK